MRKAEDRGLRSGGHFGEPLRFVHASAERLLHEEMFAGPKDCESKLGVERVRRRNHDRVDVGGRDQFMVVVSDSSAILLLELLEPGPFATG